MALADEIRAFAAYVNAPRDHFDADELALLDEDLAKARAAMEVAWLETLAAPTTFERPLFDPVIGLTTTSDPEGW